MVPQTQTWAELIAKHGFRTTQQVELAAGFNGGQLSPILNGKQRKLWGRNMRKLVQLLGEPEDMILAAMHAEAAARQQRRSITTSDGLQRGA